MQPTDSTAAITDIDFSYDNSKLLTCGPDDDDFLTVANWASGSRVTQKKEPYNHVDLVACKWSKNNDVIVSIQNNRVEVYSIPATGGIGGPTSRIFGSNIFTDVAARPLA